MKTFIAWTALAIGIALVAYAALPKMFAIVMLLFFGVGWQ